MARPQDRVDHQLPGFHSPCQSRRHPAACAVASVIRARANREATDLRTQADRVERDYRRGALPAEGYARRRTEIASGLAAAAAEAERLTAHAAKATHARGNLDAEDEALRRLTDLRAAVAGQVSGATDVGRCGPRWRPCSGASRSSLSA